MKALFIGGTGTISKVVSRKLVEAGWDLTLLNRGRRSACIPGARQITADIFDENTVRNTIINHQYDVVADFIAFVPAHIERDIRLFTGHTKQYIFISSASVYQKPLSCPIITESTPLANPYWQYSRDKIACEDRLTAEYRKNAFPVTIIRPSHTYDETHIPTAIHGDKGAWQVIKRMLDNKPVLLPGDGTSLWTVTSSADFAKGFIGLMANPRALGDVFHITSDESLTWNQIYSTISEILEVSLKPCYIPSSVLSESKMYDFHGSLFGDKAVSVMFDNSKIKRYVPDFVCSIRFEQGARETLHHMLSHPECQIEDKAFDRYCDLVSDIMERTKSQIRQIVL